MQSAYQISNISTSTDDPDYAYVGTLGDRLTYSYDATLSWGKAQKIVTLPSFEAAAEQTMAGRLSAFVCPGAYPSVNQFFVEPKLRIAEVLIHNLPPMVLASRNPAAPDQATVLFHHPATAVVLPDVKIPFQRTEHATSNSDACKRLLQCKEEALAITNRMCVEHYGLHELQVLRTVIEMPFYVFVQSTSFAEEAAA